MDGHHRWSTMKVNPHPKLQCLEEVSLAGIELFDNQTKITTKLRFEMIITG